MQMEGVALAVQRRISAPALPFFRNLFRCAQILKVQPLFSQLFDSTAEPWPERICSERVGPKPVGHLEISGSEGTFAECLPTIGEPDPDREHARV